MKAFLVAGEPSGDALGGALMAGLRAEEADVTFDGVGGAQMQAQGLVSRFPMDELSVMGIAEVLPKYRALKRRIAETVNAVVEQRPDVLITIDSPDFCLRVARGVKAQADVRTVHYVAPSVWAWRPGRAAKMARMIDHVLALLPFEPPYMEAAGMRCDFVGHPVAAQPVVSGDEILAFRAQHGLGMSERLLLVLPGSRQGEIARLGPRIGAALEVVTRAHNDLKIVVPAAGPVAAAVQDLVRDWPGSPLVLDPRGLTSDVAEAQKRVAFAAADFAMAASGTVALELARAETPMVSLYDLNWVSRQIVQRMIRIDATNLVNIVSETDVVPECLAENCRPDYIAERMIEVIANPDPQRAAMQLTMERLGAGGVPPGLRAARAVLDGMATG